MNQQYPVTFWDSALFRSRRVLRYREMAADKLKDYESRCRYDQWVARDEDAIIRLAGYVMRGLGL